MGDRSRGHSFLEGQMDEWIKVCEGTWQEAAENDVSEVTSSMKDIYSNLIDLSQEIRIYMAAVSDVRDQSDFKIVKDRIQSMKENNMEVLQAEKDRKMNEQLKKIGEFQGEGAIDEEIQVKGGTSGTICPLTNKIPEKPVVSRICGHVFEAEAIRQYIQSYPNSQIGGAPCPMVGCSKMLKLKDIVEDAATTKACEEARKNAEEDVGYEKV